MIEKNQIIPEDGTPQISLYNVRNLKDSVGDIVGILHCLVPHDIFLEETNFVKKQISHLTRIFYSKGYQHTSWGFFLGYKDGMPEENYFKQVALQISTASIWGLAPIVMDNQFEQLATDCQTEDLLKAYKNVYFLFRTPEHSRVGNFLINTGYLTMMSCIFELLQSNEKIIMIGAKDE